MAQVALNQKDLVKAVNITEGTLIHLATGSLVGTMDPFEVCSTCCSVLQANNDGLASDLRLRVHQQLHDRATEVVNEGLRRLFLEKVPSHRKLTKLYEESDELEL